MGRLGLKKILIIDDEQDFLDLVRQRLDGIYQIFTATDGEKGYAAALDLKPDLILLDIIMPHLDGYGLLKKLRAHQETAEILVVVMTSVGETHSILDAEELGVIDYLIKPVHLETLPAFIASHI